MQTNTTGILERDDVRDQVSAGIERRPRRSLFRSNRVRRLEVTVGEGDGAYDGYYFGKAERARWGRIVGLEDPLIGRPGEECYTPV